VATARTHTALVTGANRGLGLETARQLLARGLDVVLAGRDDDALDRAFHSLDRAGQQAMTVRMDVTNPESIRSAQRAVAGRFGGVDILVNNAAVLLFENEDVLSGAIEVSRVFAPAMAQSGYGRIVNVSSGAGQLARMSDYAPAYSMSKAALNAFTRILAHTYQRSGVLVNAADPGWVRTDMGGPSAPRSPREGADTIVWLATLPDDGPTGEFFHDRQPIAW